MKIFFMKKIILIIFVLISFAGLSTIAETVEKEHGFISVNMSETKEIQPNQAEITIGIETSDKSIKKASEDNKIIANNVYSALKSILAKDDYIKTNNYSVRPQYIYTKDNKKVLDKYIVVNTVIAKTKKVDLISKLIDTATEQGATNIDNLQFNATDYDESCNEALAEIAQKAYKQAGSIAKSVNTSIAGVKTMSATCNPNNGPRPFYAMAAKVLSDNASPTPIESGKIKINVNLDASFYVK